MLYVIIYWYSLMYITIDHIKGLPSLESPNATKVPQARPPLCVQAIALPPVYNYYM